VHSSQDTIRKYIKQYGEKIDYYLEVARLCKEQCETLLERNGIRHITTYRAKRPDRLEEKILKRSSDHLYETLEDITSDIPDLAGVRIALYFPGDRAKAVSLISDNFVIHSTKAFPIGLENKVPTSGEMTKHVKRFAGYSATHARMSLKPASLHPDKERYARAMIELQIASVLMHAWAEVEHDLVYKPLEGQLSEQELALLDQVNGLVMAGEIALERLQEAIKLRVTAQDAPFNNQYELAAMLHNAARVAQPTSVSEPAVGRADVLLDFLREVGLDRTSKLAPFLQGLNWGSSGEPISDQLIANAIASDPKLTEQRSSAYERVLGRASMASPKGSLPKPAMPSPVTLFIKRWVTLEQALRTALRAVSKGSPDHLRPVTPTRSAIRQLGIFSEEELSAIERLQRLRHELIDTDLTPSTKQLDEAARQMARLIQKLLDQLPLELSTE
jgi:ppGpp synthetase/RelA/SpoT-type nucleotidyltranferase